MRILLVFVCFFVAANSNESNGDDNWTFSRRLVQRLLKPPTKGSLYTNGSDLYSPLMLEITLMMLIHGARRETQQELLKILGPHKFRPANASASAYIRDLIEAFDRESDEDFKIKASNRLYVDYRYPVNINYAYKIAKLYKAEVIGVNMADKDKTLSKINNWIKKTAVGKVEVLYHEHHIPKEGTILPVTYFYFEGKWPEKFLEEDGSFWQDDGQQKSLTNLKGIHTAGYEDNKFLRAQVLSLPFVHKGQLKVVMNFYLPHRRGGMNELLQRISSNYSEVIWRCPSKQRAVDVTIPKFKLSGRIGETHLFTLGFQNIFKLHDSVSRPDYDNIFPEAILENFRPISSISVTSDGVNTEPTASVPAHSKLNQSNSTEAEVKFIADHPFVFAILTEPTGDLLYVGTYQGPEAETHLNE